MKKDMQIKLDEFKERKEMRECTFKPKLVANFSMTQPIEQPVYTKLYNVKLNSNP